MIELGRQHEVYLLIDPWVMFHLHQPLSCYDKPLHHVLGIKNFDGREETVIVGQEVAIYGRSYPGDVTHFRLLATAGEEDAQDLLRQLKGLDLNKPLPYSPPIEPDRPLSLEASGRYPKARSLIRPKVSWLEESVWRTISLRRPLPWGAKEAFPLLIEAAFGQNFASIPSLLLGVEDAKRLAEGIEKSLKNFKIHFAPGPDSEYWEKFYPDRLVRFPAF